MGIELPATWYRTSFSENFSALFWEEGGDEKAQMIVDLLGLKPGDEILDLACGTGQRVLKLCGMGLPTTGVDPCGLLIEVGVGLADVEDPWTYFVEEDPIYIGYKEQFDVVLSVGGGAFEHYHYDEECERAIGAAADALRPNGRLLMQLPNSKYVLTQLPPRTWIRRENVIELIDQEWNPVIHRIGGTRTTLVECETPKSFDPISFQRRIYEIDELAVIFARNGLVIENIYDEFGQPCKPSNHQREIYIEARKVAAEPRA